MEQGDAAAAVGISRVSLSRYENGRQRPPHDIVDQLLNVYAETIRARNAKYPDTRGIGNVSRGTVQESPGGYVADLKAGAMWVDLDPRTRSRLDRLDAFERAMVRERATDEDVKFIRARGVAFLRSLRVDDYLEEVDDDEDAAEAAVDAEFDNGAYPLTVSKS